MNINIYTGRPTRVPDVSYYGDGGENNVRTSFSLAVRRIYKREGEPEADFIPCIAFGKVAKTIANHVNKGAHILVRGQMRNNNYEKDGNKVYGFQMVVDSIEFLDKKTETGGKEQNQVDENGFMNMPEGLDEELPFN